MRLLPLLLPLLCACSADPMAATSPSAQWELGMASFAAGAQWREESYSATRNELYTQSIDPATGETIPVDLIFLGGGLPIDESRADHMAFRIDVLAS